MKLDDIKDPFVGVNQAGVYEGIVGIEVRKTKGDGGKSQKLMIVPTLTITAPDNYLGATKDDFMVIGTDEDSRRKLADDPLAGKDATWAAKAGNLKELASACGWPGDREIVFQAHEDFPKVPMALLNFCTGKKVWFTVKQEREEAKGRDGQPNPRAGQVNGRIAKYFKPGTPGIKVGLSSVQMEPVDHTASTGQVDMTGPMSPGLMAPPAE